MSTVDISNIRCPVHLWYAYSGIDTTYYTIRNTLLISSTIKKFSFSKLSFEWAPEYVYNIQIGCRSAKSMKTF